MTDISVEQERRTRVGAGQSFRLTERDADILKFIYEQKFVTLEILYFRFFDRREKASDSIPENMWVTRQRIAALRRAGMISSQRVYTDAKAVYLLTMLGYQVVRSKRELLAYNEPIQEVDFRYFEHDKRVTLCRVALERSQKCLKWFPERYLRNYRRFDVDGTAYKIPGDAIPDGVFLSSKNTRVAFELEFTPKKRERYGDKYRRYLRLMDTRDGFDRVQKVFDHVMIIACTDRIGKDLQEIHNVGEFTIISYEKLVGGLLGHGGVQ